MKRTLCAVVLALLVAAIPAASASAADSVIVKYKNSAATSAVNSLTSTLGLGQQVDTVRHSGAVVLAADDPAAAAAALQRSPLVAYAEPNKILRASATPNDPLFGDLYGMQKIQAPAGWDAAGLGSFPASGGVKVGIVDTGIQASHPDLAGKVVDCARSQGVAPIFSGTIQEGSCADDNGHGTHVAGTITANANNGTGVAGVAFNSPLSICKALSGPLGMGSTTDVANCITWLHDKGAKVISMSLGGGASTTLQSAVNYAWANGGAGGSVLVAAAGNDGDSTLNYPAAYPNVVSVAATDQNDARASFSNANSDVEVAAPGVQIESTWNDGGYNTIDGTSMATPHVSGVTAIIRDRFPSSTAAQVVAKLDAAVDDLGPAGRDPSFGFGRVNLLPAATQYPASDHPDPRGAAYWGAAPRRSTVSITVATAVKTAAPPYVKGFETLDEESTIDSLELSGELPAWLSGSLLRTGPARFEVGQQNYRHWFDGLTMLHRFSFGNGDVSYGNRFLRGKTWHKAEETGRIPYPEFATDPCRSVFKRIQTMFAPDFGDNANINVVRLGDRYLTMTEAPISVQFDPATLEAAGVPFMPPGMVTTAHPHLDRATKGMLNYAAKLGPRNEYRFFHLAPDSDEPRVTGKIPVKRPGYVHSFGLTENFIVFAEFPWVVNPLDLALSGRPYVENYKWEPDRGTRFFLVDRATGQASEPITTDPCFGFHHLNAYEDDDGTIVADIQTYEDASIVEQLYLDRVRRGTDLPMAELRRFRIDRGRGTVTHEKLIETTFELGRINYGRCNERPYRYAWGVAASPGNWIDEIVKADVVDRSHIGWSEPGAYPGEPVFVAEPGAEDEDAGVVLSVVLDSQRGTSYLLVLDASDLTEVARASVPHHIPFHFHGIFSRDQAPR